MEILAKLFGSTTKVRLMRMFLFNEDNAYSFSDIAERTKSQTKECKREINGLLNIGLIKKKQIIKDLNIKKGKKIQIKKIQEIGYLLDQKFPYLQALKNLLITVSLHADDNLVKKFATVGRIKLFLASGVFIQEWDTRVDLLIVGDDINFTKLDAVIKSIEAEVGREIVYSAFETEDFEYRYGMHDRLIMDIVDFPHATLVDKLGIDNR
jgi:DNA-binding Lrp family transcriptional regulator